MKQFENKIDCENMIIHLNDYTTIVDLKKFIESHQSITERNKDNKYFNPYVERLTEVKKIVDENSNR